MALSSEDLQSIEEYLESILALLQDRADDDRRDFNEGATLSSLVSLTELIGDQLRADDDDGYEQSVAGLLVQMSGDVHSIEQIMTGQDKQSDERRKDAEGVTKMIKEIALDSHNTAQLSFDILEVLREQRETLERIALALEDRNASHSQSD